MHSFNRHYLVQHGFFVIRHRFIAAIHRAFRKLSLSLLGMKIGDGTVLSKLYVTWPNQVAIGTNCMLEHDIHFKFDGIWESGPAIILNDNVFVGFGCEFNIRKSIVIGANTLIASGCKFIDHDHGITPGELMRKQPGPELPIRIGANVWLGCNVVVLKGVEIGDGAVVAAGAVVTKLIQPNEIWAGVPARKIGERTGC